MRLRHHKHKLFMTHLTSLIKCGCDYSARWQMERWMDRSEVRGWRARGENTDAFLVEINNYLICGTWRNDECSKVGRRSVKIKKGIKNESRNEGGEEWEDGSVLSAALGSCSEWAGKMEWTGCMGRVKGAFLLYMITLIPPVSTHQSAILLSSSGLIL